MIEKFVNLTEQLTDAPPDYARFAALFLISKACRYTTLRIGGTKIKLNLWITIVGKSSVFHKSTVVRLVDDFHAKLGFPVISYDASREGLMKVMSTSPQASMLISEFSFFMDNSRKEYMAGTLPFLADVYDCPNILARQTMAGEIKIENPNVSIFSASSDSWLRPSLKQVDVEGGFMARFMMCFPQKKEKEYIVPFCSDINKIAGLKRIITIGLKDIEAYSSNMNYIEIEKQALDFVEKFWKLEYKEGVLPDAIINRHVIYHLKVGTILALNNIRKKVVLADVIEAAKLISISLEGWRLLLDLGIGKNFFNTVREKIMYSKGKSISRKGLLKKISTSSARIDPVISTLIQRGEVKVVKKDKEVYYEVVGRET